MSTSRPEYGILIVWLGMFVWQICRELLTGTDLVSWMNQVESSTDLAVDPPRNISGSQQVVRRSACPDSFSESLGGVQTLSRYLANLFQASSC
jgi:hypothetical protein